VAASFGNTQAQHTCAQMTPPGPSLPRRRHHRDPSADIRVNSTAVSRKHAMLNIEQGRVVLCSVSTVNPVCLHGDPVGAPVALQDGDTFTVGQQAFRFRAGGMHMTGCARVRLARV
jgi:pSer/pThr/pTyr-binding forkhead associated (FHA) protein